MLAVRTGCDKEGEMRCCDEQVNSRQADQGGAHQGRREDLGAVDVNERGVVGGGNFGELYSRPLNFPASASVYPVIALVASWKNGLSCHIVRFFQPATV